MSNLPSSDQPIYRPAPTTSAPTIIILILLFACSVPTIGIMLGLLLPAIQQAREAARRMTCSNNARQIGLALLSYESAFNSLPPAYTVDGDGNKLHSWRTLILPFIGQQALYDRIDLSKPWNDPSHEFAMKTSIGVYACPSAPPRDGGTTYQVIVDPLSAFPGVEGIKFAEIKDGISNTVLVCESDPALAVHWMEPDDLSLAEFTSTGSARQGNPSHAGGSHCCMGDGSVRFLASEEDPLHKRALATIAGGEPIPADAPGN